MMTNDELLSRARVFDAGPPPTINQFILDEDDDSQGHNLTIEYRGKTGWAICGGGRICLDKVTGELEYESMPTHRGEDFIARTRFASPQEAFEYLATWKHRTREAALRLDHMTRWKDQLRTWADEKRAKGELEGGAE